MSLPRFLVIGGFLGAGKTTTLLHLARRFHEQGKRVGLITNDQAANLVDTEALRVRGFRVEEVAGACFCCKFDDLALAAEKLRLEERPDILLGEPVGSCTDLAATVVSPLRRLYGDRYEIAPYSVLVDPIRARQMVVDRGFGGFSSKVAYIFQKQLEEANVIVLNKVDLLTDSERRELRTALEREFSNARVVEISAKTGEGIDSWLALLESHCAERAVITPVDYDIYAEGEAELGWLNMAIAIDSASGIDCDGVALAIVEAISSNLRRENREIAHLKVLVGAGNDVAIANDVGGERGAQLSRACAARPTRAMVTVNARAHFDPQELRAIADRSLHQIAAKLGFMARVDAAAQFRPGRPVPIHRDAVGA